MISAVKSIGEPFSLGDEFALEDEDFDRIHLIDVFIPSGEFRSLPRGMQWRGRLKEVVGWSFGAVELEDPDAPNDETTVP